MSWIIDILSHPRLDQKSGLTEREAVIWIAASSRDGVFKYSERELAELFGWTRGKLVRFIDKIKIDPLSDQISIQKSIQSKSVLEVKIVNDINGGKRAKSLHPRPSRSTLRSEIDPLSDPKSQNGRNHTISLSTCTPLLPPQQQNELVEHAPHVLLTKVDFDRLTKKLGGSLLKECIEFFSDWQVEDTSGKRIKDNKNRNHSLCITRWVVDAVETRRSRRVKTGVTPAPPSGPRPEHRIFRAERSNPTPTQAQAIINQVTRKLSVK